MPTGLIILNFLYEIYSIKLWNLFTYNELHRKYAANLSFVLIFESKNAKRVNYPEFYNQSEKSFLISACSLILTKLVIRFSFNINKKSAYDIQCSSF